MLTVSCCDFWCLFIDPSSPSISMRTMPCSVIFMWFSVRWMLLLLIHFCNHTVLLLLQVFVSQGIFKQLTVFVISNEQRTISITCGNSSFSCRVLYTCMKCFYWIHTPERLCLWWKWWTSRSWQPCSIFLKVLQMRSQSLWTFPEFVKSQLFDFCPL